MSLAEQLIATLKRVLAEMTEITGQIYDRINRREVFVDKKNRDVDGEIRRLKSVEVS